MALMRLFVAIDLPKDLKKEILPIAEKIAKEVPLRLVARENLHLTLVFLGEQNENRVEDIMKALSSVVSLFSLFRLTLEDLAVFPDNGAPSNLHSRDHLSAPRWERNPSEARLSRAKGDKRPRGIWFNVGGQKEKLFSLYKKMVDGLLNEGLTIEQKYLNFSPHCTIGRIPEKIKMPGNIGEKIAWVNLRKEFFVEKVILYQSKLTPKGPEYFKLGEYELR